MRTVTLNICAIAFVCGTNLSAEDGKPMTSTNSIGIEFIEVREGTYQMGSPASEEGRKDNENPVRVSITVGYWLGKTEVTQGQWKQVMETQPWADQKGVGHGDDYPAACLSWDDCMAFCEKLTQRERESGSLSAEERYRLPTEAEWEYACRAGSTTMFSFGNDGSNLNEHAFFEENAPQHALEVGKKKPNPWGFCDMHGNVFEWCSDCFGTLAGGDDPAGPSSGAYRVYRGGSWRDTPVICRSAHRFNMIPSVRFNTMGLRLARSQSAQ